MKKLILILCFIVFTSPKIYSQLFEEHFDYPLLTILSTTATWDAVSASGFVPILVDIPLGGLSFPSYSGSTVGNAVTLLPGLPIVGGEDDAGSLSSTQTSGSIYASFMLNVITAQIPGDYFFSLRTTGGADVARVYARPDAILGYNLGIEKSTGAGVVYASSGYSFSLVTYLVVVKYTFVAGAGNDAMSLFIFDPSSPPPDIEPTPTLGPITFPLGTDAVNIDEVLLRQGEELISPTLIIDGIIVDNFWNNTALPVELSSFTSTINRRDVTLNWSTASEQNNSGFEILRSAQNDNETWINIGFAQGNGTTNSLKDYSFIDRGLNSGKYNYRLKQIDYNGNFEYFNLSNEINIGLPTRYDLSQNYPNPFNPSTKINYDLPFDGRVSIKLFDMSGREVAVLADNIFTAGYYTIDFNASNLSSGVYFYRLEVISVEENANNFIATKKLMLIK